MPLTTIRGKQVLDGTIQRHDLDVSTVGQAVVAKLVQGTNVTLSSTGGDAGTGDVTISTVPLGPPTSGVVTKTAAYTLLTTDVSKFFICSGGAFALTFPSAVTAGNGWSILIRNLYANSTAQGTVSLTSVSSQAFNGLASPFPLLPGQECTVISDGANWQIFGLVHEVLLATVDILAGSVANQTIALPTGYRYFDIAISGLFGSLADTIFQATLSTDNGSTYGTFYGRGNMYNATSTTLAYGLATGAATINLGPAVGTAFTTRTGFSNLKIYPGSAARFPSFTIASGALGDATAMIDNYFYAGFGNFAGPVNFLKITPGSGNIVEAHITVFGVA